jgi:hypothetical protein
MLIPRDNFLSEWSRFQQRPKRRYLSTASQRQLVFGSDCILEWISIIKRLTGCIGTEWQNFKSYACVRDTVDMADTAIGVLDGDCPCNICVGIESQHPECHIFRNRCVSHLGVLIWLKNKFTELAYPLDPWSGFDHIVTRTDFLTLLS